MMESSSDYSDEEVGVVACGRRLWVRGVRGETTCADVVGALLADGAIGVDKPDGEWSLAERWRGVERPLPPDACVLGVLNAWGDARNEVRLSLRFASAEDSGRDSPCCSPRRRRDTPAARLVGVIQQQTRTIHQQLDKLRDQEKQIDRFEDQTHKTRMEKHGTNYLLESYLQDIGRSTEIADSQAGNSDSGVGGSGTPPRRHKHKSRRERHLMREHYFTKELTDICQINSDRIHPDTDSDVSTDELSKIKEEIDLLEKMAIINKRLHREEELIVRLNAKVKRYMDEENAKNCNPEQINVLLERIADQISETTQEMENNALEIEKTNIDIEERLRILEELTLEVAQEELENKLLEKEIQDRAKRQPIMDEESFANILDDNSNEVYFSGGAPYPLDTLV